MPISTESSPVSEVPAGTPKLRRDLKSATVSQWESIGQSFASIAPTAAPAMGVPFVLAISGNGSWLAYLLATAGVA